MTEKEKIFQIEIVFRCGREVAFLLEDHLCQALTRGVACKSKEMINLLDKNGIQIVLDPMEVAFCIVREYVNVEQNAPASRGTH